MTIQSRINKLETSLQNNPIMKQRHGSWILSMSNKELEEVAGVKSASYSNISDDELILFIYN